MLDFIRLLRVPVQRNVADVPFTGDLYKPLWMKDAFFTDADDAELWRTIAKMMREKYGQGGP